MAALLLVLLGCSSDVPKARGPNVLLVLADDLGFADVGYRGSPIRTPNLDALAAAGVRADDFYALPTCTASRAALLTGRFPARYGLQSDVIRPWDTFGLDLAERTLAQRLLSSGYTTALVGKWHLGMAREAYLPTHRGFEHHYGLYGGLVDYYTHKRYGGLDWHRDDAPVREAGYATDLLAADAAARISAHASGRPFFLMLAFTAPHEPLEAPPADVAAYAALPGEDRRTYAAMVTVMDRGLGRVLDALDAASLRRDTLVIFLGDNGGDVDAGASNAPLRGSKGSLGEGGMRVPAVWSWPGVLPEGVSTEVPMHLVDVVPTVLAAAGLPPGHDLDGTDVLPWLRGGTPDPPRQLLLDLAADAAAFRQGPWKLMVYGPLAAPRGVRLYDLATDPSERDDRAAAEPGRVSEMLSALRHIAPPTRPPLAKTRKRPMRLKGPEVWGPAAFRSQGRG